MKLNPPWMMNREKSEQEQGKKMCAMLGNSTRKPFLMKTWWWGESSIASQDLFS